MLSKAIDGLKWPLPASNDLKQSQKDFTPRETFFGDWQHQWIIFCTEQTWQIRRIRIYFLLCCMLGNKEFWSLLLCIFLWSCDLYSAISVVIYWFGTLVSCFAWYWWQTTFFLLPSALVIETRWTWNILTCTRWVGMKSDAQWAF